MIRNWAEAQADQHGQIKRLLEVLTTERQGGAHVAPQVTAQPVSPRPTPHGEREKENV